LSFIGVDLGTAGCKAILLGENGKILAEAGGQYDLLTPQPGWAELDPTQVFNTVKQAIGVISQAAKFDPVKAISVSSMGDTVTPCDGDGNPVGNSILAFDTRNIAESDQYKEKFGADWIFKITGQPVHPTYSITKILWIKRHFPELFKSAKKYLCYEDFITCQLCGEAVISHSSAGRVMAFDINKMVWNTDLLEMAGIDTGKLATPMPSGKKIGKIKPSLATELGLPKNVTVVSGGHDQPCGSLGSGYFKNDYAMDSTGTVEVLLVTRSEPVLTDKMLNANICFWPHVVEGEFCACGQILTAGAAFRWFRDALSDGEAYNSITSKFADGPSELLFIPHLAGSGTPEFSPTAKGAFYGATLQTNKYEIAKAIIEGVCFELKVNIDLLERAGITIKGMRAIGGAAQSTQWMQMKANITGKDIEACQFVNQCPLGAAILAAYGVGFFDSLEETTDFITHKVKVYKPFQKRQEEYVYKFQNYSRFRSAVFDLNQQF
jgi:xylulokinase